MIEINYGDRKNHLVTLIDSSTKEPFDLTGYRVLFCAKEKLDHPDSAIRISLDSDDGSIIVSKADEGEIELRFLREHTLVPPRDYYYDIRCLENNTGEPVSSDYDILRIKKMVREKFPGEV